jgi:hypothetical protein
MVQISYLFVSSFTRLQQTIDLLKMLVLIKVIDIVLESLLFNTISPIARSRLRFIGLIYFDLSSTDYYHG